MIELPIWMFLADIFLSVMLGMMVAVHLLEWAEGRG
jgi:hypothetical protein